VISENLGFHLINGFLLFSLKCHLFYVIPSNSCSGRAWEFLDVANSVPGYLLRNYVTLAI